MGRAVRAYWKNYHGWFNGHISFTYNDAGLVSEGKIIEDGKEIGFINFKYDNNARLIEEYWEFSENYDQTFTFEYKETASLQGVGANFGRIENMERFAYNELHYACPVAKRLGVNIA